MRSTFIDGESPAVGKETVANVRSFESFYRDTHQSMIGVAIALTSSAETAEDLVQEAFVAAHNRWDRVSQYDKPAAWVRRVLINQATSLRRRWRAELRALATIGPPDEVHPDLSPETSSVWQEVRRLSRRQQQAIVLHYVGQLSLDEVADVMGCSAGSVKSHLHRGRESLRKSFSAWSEETP